MGNRRVAQVVFVFGFLILGTGAFWLGSHFAKSSREDARGPAAVPRTYDFSHLEGAALREASVKQILSGTKTLVAGSLSGLQMGHFTMRSSSGVSVSVCDIYPTIELQFIAGDMAVSGESPEMFVTGDCSMADTPGVLDPVMFDYMAVRATQVQEQSVRQPQADNNEVKFKNVSDTWPRVWVLKKIKFISPGASQTSLEISDQEIRQSLGKNIALEW
jgi:hypothetical protein